MGGYMMRVDVNNASNQYTPNAQVNSRHVELASEVQKSKESDEPIDMGMQQEQDVIEAIEKANKHFRSYDRRLEFSIHEQTKQIMVKVISTEDDSIIREIPSEKILDMVAKLWEMAGIFVDEKR
ncbi:flagellar protein FlaG [Vallitalea pronyensis]|uniref:Flagellar protein FlaG n=2 Tax=Vallitalea pronyensis TaxID=1348613 RepID=A0A8J8MHA3_9FIRM|nr:flagellar protein FlaG [Vallitalea pronyensis]